MGCVGPGGHYEAVRDPIHTLAPSTSSAPAQVPNTTPHTASVVESTQSSRMLLTQLLPQLVLLQAFLATRLAATGREDAASCKCRAEDVVTQVKAQLPCVSLYSVSVCEQLQSTRVVLPRTHQ